jgi:predicted DsbA family dithiol-disulfide isomerase
LVVHHTREQYGLVMNPGPFNFNSRPALIGAKYAEAEGYGQVFHAEIMRRYWLEAEDISDRAALVTIAGSLGMSRDEFLSALDDPRYVEAVEQEKAQARAYGLDAVPAMIFADKYLVSGAQPYGVLTEVVERIQQMSAGSEGVEG